MIPTRHTQGAVVVDGQHVANTLQCVHCGAHEEIIVGSGKKRGWCYLCRGTVCGQDICMKTCSPVEARLELSEAIDAGRFDEAKAIRTRFKNINPI